MKKNNPSIGKPYKRGDLSPCKTKRFWAYKTAHVNKDGFFSIHWKSIENFERDNERNNLKNRKQNALNKTKNLPKRLNPETGKPFKLGDKRSDGYYFTGYGKNGVVKGGYMGEAWLNPDSYLKYRIGLTYGKIQKRASENRIPINIDADYLYEIYPENSTCPILEIFMEFGNDRDNSPSVDRLIPKLGYVKGNVTWVSKLVNVVKKDLTSHELRCIADWIENQPIWKAHFQTLTPPS